MLMGRGSLMLYLLQVTLLLLLEDLCESVQYVDIQDMRQLTSGSFSCTVLEYRRAIAAVRETGATAARRRAVRVAREYMTENISKNM